MSSSRATAVQPVSSPINLIGPLGNTLTRHPSKKSLSCPTETPTLTTAMKEKVGSEHVVEIHMLLSPYMTVAQMRACSTATAREHFLWTLGLVTATINTHRVNFLCAQQPGTWTSCTKHLRDRTISVVLLLRNVSSRVHLCVDRKHSVPSENQGGASTPTARKSVNYGKNRYLEETGRNRSLHLHEVRVRDAVLV